MWRMAAAYQASAGVVAAMAENHHGIKESGGSGINGVVASACDIGESGSSIIVSHGETAAAEISSAMAAAA